MIRAKPIPSFFSTRGSNPNPSPYDVYCASSSPQVIGQLSLSIAARRISAPKPLRGSPGSAGTAPRYRDGVHQRLHQQVVDRAPEARLGVTQGVPVAHHDQVQTGHCDDHLVLAPAPANASRGASGQMPSVLVYHASPEAGAGSVALRAGRGSPWIGQHLLHHVAPDQLAAVPLSLAASSTDPPAPPPAR